MTLTRDERMALRRRCSIIVPEFRTLTPAEEFRALADWCEAGGVAHDVYGAGALLVNFEQKVAALLGKDAAAFMPSGTMAQLIAMRIWSERRGVARFGMHPASHPALHEREAYQAVFGLHGVIVGDRLRPILARDLEAARQPLACLLVELPIREAGGQLPSWEELEALKDAAAARGLALHMDGARLWESRAFYGRTHAQIAQGFASVYVSTYKGVGGIAGAVLAGEDDFIAEARLWQKRLGGTLIRQSPMIASAAMRFDARLAMMDACHARAVELAAGLGDIAGLRVNPAPPQTNMIHLFFDTPAEAINARRDAVAADEGVWLIDDARASETPGWSRAELTVGDTLVDLDNAQIVPRFGRLLA
jgi:threonine aldolase